MKKRVLGVDDLGKPKLEFIFHDPNTKEDSIHYITKILIDSGMKKLEGVLNRESDIKIETIEKP